MGFTAYPLNPERFDDFCDVVNPNRRDTHCWCVTPRLRTREIDELGGGSREQSMRRLCASQHPPGVIAYDGDLPVGWCNIGPRAEIPRLVHSRVMAPLDDLAVWSVVCIVVRGGHRKRGVTTPLLEGAVEYAASHGAPAVEAYPVDPRGRVDTTMAYVGTRAMFEKVGFSVVGRTDAEASKLPRLIMRRTVG